MWLRQRGLPPDLEQREAQARAERRTTTTSASGAPRANARSCSGQPRSAPGRRAAAARAATDADAARRPRRRRRRPLSSTPNTPAPPYCSRAIDGASAYHCAYTHSTAPAEHRDRRPTPTRASAPRASRRAARASTRLRGRRLAAARRGCTRASSSRAERRTSPRRTRTPRRRRRRAPAPSPSAGPTQDARFAIDSVSARASWISVARGPSAGAGRCRRAGRTPRAAPNSASITTISQIATPPLKISTASSVCSAARTRSVAIMIRWRGSRSAHTPPNSSSVTSGSACAPSTRPRSVAEPVGCGHVQRDRDDHDPSPTALAAWPRNRNLKFGWRRTRRYELIDNTHSSDGERRPASAAATADLQGQRRPRFRTTSWQAMLSIARRTSTTVGNRLAPCRRRSRPVCTPRSSGCRSSGSARATTRTRTSSSPRSCSRPRATTPR